MRSAGRPERDGFVLVLMTGILSLLLLAGVALTRVAAELRRASWAAEGATRARMAAESGMEYAAARLTAVAYPRWLEDPSSRGDDWVCRRPEHNPSFSHGEPWLNRPFRADGLDNDGDGLADEPAEGDGILEPGEAWVDRDGDGRFSAWSGRLRGEGEAGSSRFALRVEGSESRIPLNAGALWKEDRWGRTPTGPNGRPDHGDPEIQPHKGLIHCLNNLGALLRHRDPATFSTRCEEVPTGRPDDPGDPIWVSWLGHDLLTRRPEGGYRSFREVRAAMREAGYAEGECDRILPFLDLGPYEPFAMSARTSQSDAPVDEGGRPVPFPVQVPVRLSTAPPEILQALWMYHAAFLTAERVPGDPGGWQQSDCRRTGTPGLGALPFCELTIEREIEPVTPPWDFTLILFPDEAEAIAARTASFRQEGRPFVWREFYRALLDAAPALFARDAADLADFPVHQRSWVQAKAEMAFRTVCVDPHLGGPDAWGCAAWAAWGLDRDGDPDDGVEQPHAAFSAAGMMRIRYPSAFPAGPWVNLLRSKDPYAPFTYGEGAFRAQGGTWAPCGIFSVESRGEHPARASAHSLDAHLRAFEVLEWTSQEDFENLAGSRLQALGRSPYSGLGIRVLDPAPIGRREARTDAAVSPARSYPSTVTFPRAGRHRQAGTPANALLAGYGGYSPFYGAVALAARKAGRQGAWQYWPFQEDADWDPHPLVPGSPLGTDFWSESPPGIPRLRMPVRLTAQTQDEAAFPFAFGNGGLWEPRQGLKLDVPGFSPGRFVNGVTFELWASPGSVLKLYGAERPGVEWPANWIDLRIARDGHLDGLFGTSLQLSVSWLTEVAGASGALFPPVFIEDRPFAPYSTRAAWMLHVVMGIERNADSTTTFRFYVNGMDRDPISGLPLELRYDPYTAKGANHNGNMKGSYEEYLALSAIDEIRIYDRLLSLDEARERYRMERFVREGGFVSPLYVLDEPAVLLGGSWTGISPAGLFRAADEADPVRSGPLLDPATARPEPLDPFRVTVQSYAAAPAGEGPPLPPPDAEREMPREALAELAGTGAARAFRYRLEIDCRKAAGVLNDTPVFESIWIALRRPGRAGPWSGWSQR